MWTRKVLVFAIGLVLAGGATATFLVLDERAERRELESERRALTNYLRVVEPLAREGGEVVTLGLKPGIGDIRQREISGELLLDQTEAWIFNLNRVRATWANVPTPMPDAHALFLDALARYLEVAEMLEEAVRARPSGADELLEAAAEAGESADDTWDRAAGLVQDRLRELGLAPVSWLPSL